MNIQRKNSAHHFRMQSEREQTLITFHLHPETWLYSPDIIILNEKYDVWSARLLSM